MPAANGGLAITVLGSGTSVGVPTIGCHCDVCNSLDPRDNRMRPSIFLRYGKRVILIDTTPDLRTQALRARMERLDAILFTHSHADHIMGLDDVRPFNFRQSGFIPIYGSEDTIGNIRRCFPYIFEDREPQAAIPRLTPNVFKEGETLDLFGLPVTPLRVDHGNSIAWGFRFGPAAYLTDHNTLPGETLAQLEGLDVLFLDALRHKPHPKHSHLQQSLQYVEQLAPKRAFFTHICHDLAHERTERMLPPHVRLAYDGLEVDIAYATPAEAGTPK
jgi:phosphoribosyl 1,2-cyclic phosphate phosphodiesterase